MTYFRKRYVGVLRDYSLLLSGFCALKNWKWNKLQVGTHITFITDRGQVVELGLLKQMGLLTLNPRIRFIHIRAAWVREKFPIVEKAVGPSSGGQFVHEGRETPEREGQGWKAHAQLFFSHLSIIKVIVPHPRSRSWMSKGLKRS